MLPCSNREVKRYGFIQGSAAVINEYKDLIQNYYDKPKLAYGSEKYKTLKEFFQNFIRPGFVTLHSRITTDAAEYNSDNCRALLITTICCGILSLSLVILVWIPFYFQKKYEMEQTMLMVSLIPTDIIFRVKQLQNFANKVIFKGKE